MPELPTDRVEAVMQAIERLKEDDPYAVLQAGGMKKGKDGGRATQVLKMVPSFEISLFLAQATGSLILTDSRTRWTELLLAHGQQLNVAGEHLNSFKAALEEMRIIYPLGGDEFFTFATMSGRSRSSGWCRTFTPTSIKLSDRSARDRTRKKGALETG